MPKFTPEQLAESARKLVDEKRKADTAEAAKTPNPNAKRYAEERESLTEARAQGYKPGQRLARCIRAYLVAGERIGGTIDTLNRWGDTQIAETLSRTLEFLSPDGSSLLIPDQYSNELIPLLRPYSVLASVQPREVPMANGTMSFPRIAAGSTAFWGPPTRSNRQAGPPKFGRLTLSEKALTCVSAVPNRLIESNSEAADEFVLGDILAAMGVAFDSAHINGTGDQYQPRGILNYPTDPNQPDAINSVAGGAFDWTLPIDMLVEHQTANGTMVNPVWLGSPMLWGLLMKATTGSAGFPAWLMELAQSKSILGVPFKSTNFMPVDTTLSHNPTPLVLIDYHEFLLGVVRNLSVQRSTEAAYYDAEGNLTAAFSNNETVLKVDWAGDFGIRQTKSCTIMSGIHTDGQ